MSCAETIDNLDQPPTDYRIVADSVAFNPDVLQVTSDPNDPEGRLWSKDGLVVRAGAEFEILTTEADAGSLRFAWGTMGGDVSALAVPGCESRGWDWMVFAGGWTVDEPGCYDVLVRTDNEIHTTQMAIGEPCDTDSE